MAVSVDFEMPISMNCMFGSVVMVPYSKQYSWVNGFCGSAAFHIRLNKELLHAFQSTIRVSVFLLQFVGCISCGCGPWILSPQCELACTHQLYAYHTTLHGVIDFFLTQVIVKMDKSEKVISTDVSLDM